MRWQSTSWIQHHHEDIGDRVGLWCNLNGRMGTTTPTPTPTPTPTATPSRWHVSDRYVSPSPSPSPSPPLALPRPPSLSLSLSLSQEGVLLRDVLMYSGLLTPDRAEEVGVRHVQFEGAEGLQASIPIEKALSPYGELQRRTVFTRGSARGSARGRATKCRSKCAHLKWTLTFVYAFLTTTFQLSKVTRC
jgi:hypothetical protein